MHKNVNKPSEINTRLETPLGILSIPPNTAMYDGNDTYIIVTNRQTAERVIKEIFSPADKSTLPQ